LHLLVYRCSVIFVVVLYHHHRRRRRHYHHQTGFVDSMIVLRIYFPRQ